MRNLKKSTVLLVTLMIASMALAQNSTMQPTASGVSNYKKNKISRQDNEFNALIELDAKTINYTESSNVDSNLQQQLQIGLNLKKEGSFFYQADITVGTFSEPQSFYYVFPELYTGYGDINNNVILGRKKENLSVADTFFNFGLIQSRFTNDNINFIEGGLTGLSAHLSNDGMGVIGAFMPIFIPNQGPQIKTEDGQIISTNRWAPQPPSKFKFGNQYKNINYAIRDYKITDIISNSGFMLNAYMGQSQNNRPIFSTTYAKKPINEVAFSRDTYSDISNFEGYVYLTPTVLSHEVLAVDLNLDYKNIKSTFSYLGDEPINQEAQDLETIQTLNSLKIYSLVTSLDLTANLDQKFEIYAGAAIISGGEIRDLNHEKKESFLTVVTSRTQYKKPLRMGLKAEMFYINNKAVEIDSNMTYDQELKGSLLSAQIKYRPVKNLNLSLGVDLIGVESDLPEGVQGNFLDQNKANDRFFAGINYVF